MKPTYQAMIVHEIKKMWDRVNADPLANRNEALKKERALIDLTILRGHIFAFSIHGTLITNDSYNLGGFSKAYVNNEKGKAVVVASKTTDALFSISLTDKTTFMQVYNDWEARCEAELNQAGTSNPTYLASTSSSRGLKCTCGAQKVKTTHSDWCDING